MFEFPSKCNPMKETANYIDIILGMDWLAPYHAILDCYAKIVTLMVPEISPMVWRGSVRWASTGNISFIQAQRLISVGCSTYLALIHDLIVETATMESVSVVC